MNSVSGCDPNLHLSLSRKTETKDMDYTLMAVFQPLYSIDIWLKEKI